ncbi:MAG: DUF945 family protein [Pseudomonadota bacterium]
MKKALVLSALSSALLLSFPAVAAEPAIAETAIVKPAKPSSDMFEALAALGKELKAAMGSGRGNPIPYLDQLAAHEYSDATREKVATVFGSKEPLNIRRSTGANGQVSYAFTAPAYHYLDSNANTISWSDLVLELQLDKAGRNMVSKGSWGSFSIADKDMAMVISDISGDGKQRRNAQNIWIGKLHGAIGKIVVTPANTPAVVLDALSFASNAVEHGKAVDIGYDARIKSISGFGEQVDDIHYAMRLLNIDMRALEKLTDTLADADQAGKTKEQKLALFAEQLKSMGKTLAARGTALEIDDFSAAFHGQRATIKGKVWLAPGSGNADFASLDKFGKKIMVRLTVKVPVALVTEIAKVVTARQATAKGETQSPEAIAQAAQTATDFIVGKMLNESVAKLDNGVLVSLIEFKGGKLTCNGKEMSLPTGTRPAPAAKPEAGSAE